jgi:hypothetical protein
MMHVPGVPGCGDLVDGADLMRQADAENRRYFLEVAAGIWVHTRELLGKPTRAEVLGTLKAARLWTKRERTAWSSCWSPAGR